MNLAGPEGPADNGILAQATEKFGVVDLAVIYLTVAIHRRCSALASKANYRDIAVPEWDEISPKKSPNSQRSEPQICVFSCSGATSQEEEKNILMKYNVPCKSNTW